MKVAVSSSVKDLSAQLDPRFGRNHGSNQKIRAA